MIISILFILLMAIVLFAFVWQNKDGTSGIGWVLNKIDALRTTKNIIILCLSFVLLIYIRMFQIEVNAPRKCPDIKRKYDILKSFIADTGMASQEFLDKN